MIFEDERQDLAEAGEQAGEVNFLGGGQGQLCVFRRKISVELAEDLANADM